MRNLLDRIRAAFLPRETRAALRSFIQNYHWGEDLGTARAIRQVETGLLELLHHNGQHAANGLAVTKNGYFVTNHHCVDEDPETMRVRTASGREYPVLEVCRSNRRADIALVRAGIRGHAEPVRYRFHDRSKLNGKDLSIVVVTRWDGSIATNGGLIDGRTVSGVTKQGMIVEQHLHVQCKLRPGDSGGAMVTALGGQLAGMASTASRVSREASCTTWDDVLKIIWEWCR